MTVEIILRLTDRRKNSQHMLVMLAKIWRSPHCCLKSINGRTVIFRRLNKESAFFLTSQYVCSRHLQAAIVLWRAAIVLQVSPLLAPHRFSVGEKNWIEKWEQVTAVFPSHKITIICSFLRRWPAQGLDGTSCDLQSHHLAYMVIDGTSKRENFPAAMQSSQMNLQKLLYERSCNHPVVHGMIGDQSCKVNDNGLAFHMLS